MVQQCTIQVRKDKEPHTVSSEQSKYNKKLYKAPVHADKPNTAWLTSTKKNMYLHDSSISQCANCVDNSYI